MEMSQIAPGGPCKENVANSLWCNLVEGTLARWKQMNPETEVTEVVAKLEFAYILLMYVQKSAGKPEKGTLQWQGTRALCHIATRRLVKPCQAEFEGGMAKSGVQRKAPRRRASLAGKSYLSAPGWMSCLCKFLSQTCSSGFNLNPKQNKHIGHMHLETKDWNFRHKMCFKDILNLNLSTMR